MFSYEKYLQRRALNDKEALDILHKFEVKVSGQNSQRLTNVVEDNYNLRHELKEAMAEINKLEQKNASLNEKMLEIETVYKMNLLNQEGQSLVNDLDMYQTVDVAEIVNNDSSKANLADFASGMSEIFVGQKVGKEQGTDQQ